MPLLRFISIPVNITGQFFTLFSVAARRPKNCGALGEVTESADWKTRNDHKGVENQRPVAMERRSYKCV